MSVIIPKKLPPCAINLLARPEWFTDPSIVARANFAEANAIARFLSSPRFAGRDDIWAITLGGTIYVRMPEAYDVHHPVGLALIAHELKHVEQYEREGLFNFVRKYIGSYRAEGGYSSAVTFETEGYEFQKVVEQHLADEFWNNPGIASCAELTEPHTPNPSFVKKVPAVFRFTM